MILRRLVSAGSCLACWLAAGTLWGEPAKGIYVVDMQRVLNGAIIGKAARNNVEAQLKKSELKLGQMKLELDKLSAEVEKQSALLSATALEARRELLVKRSRDFEREVQDQRDSLGRKNESEMQKVVEEIQKVVRELSAQHGYPIVIENDARAVIYASPELDLTSEVVRMLDAKKLQF